MYEVMTDLRIGSAAVEHQLVARGRRSEAVSEDPDRGEAVAVLRVRSPTSPPAGSGRRRRARAVQPLLPAGHRHRDDDGRAARRSCPRAPSCCCGCGGSRFSTDGCGRRSSRPAAWRHPRTASRPARRRRRGAGRVGGAAPRPGVLRDAPRRPRATGWSVTRSAHRRCARPCEPEGRAPIPAAFERAHYIRTLHS